MFIGHPALVSPDDANQPLWRYQDFAKLLNLVQTSRLFFCRADLLGDPFEGSFPKKNVQFRPEWYKDILQNLPNSHEQFLRQIKDDNLRIRQWMFVNCWHMNSVESAAMWSLYGKESYSVAIRSTFARLTKSFDATDVEIFVGKVRYIDYDSDVMPEGNAFFQILHKRISFQHENELRAITLLPDDKQGELEKRNLTTPNGVFIAVNLNALIEDIYIAPSAPEWFAKTVETAIRSAGLDRPIRYSRLNDEPFF